MVRRVITGVALLALAAGSSWAADGAAAFKADCAKCHGESGTSDTAVGKAMKVPHLAGDAKVKAKSVDELIAAIKENKKHPPTVKSLGDDDLKAAAEYAKTLAAGK